MKTLKKLLAVALCMVLATGLMSPALGAGTDYRTFTDVADITQVDAVALLSTLDILRGMPDGTFSPRGNVTRAQMCKMIYVVLQGGTDDNAELYKNFNTSKTNAIKDISDSWAVGYIKYCLDKDIVAGVGGGKFLPNDNVTTVQAAKMVLISLGYKPEIEGYVGTDWTGNIIMDARDNGLLANIDTSKDLSLPASREQAARLIYNGLFAKMVQYRNGSPEYVTRDGVNLSMGTNYMNLVTLEGVLGANDEFGLGIQPASNGSSVVFTKTGGSDSQVTVNADTQESQIGYSVNVYAKLRPMANIASPSWQNDIESIYGLVEVPGKNTTQLDIIQNLPTRKTDYNTTYYINYKKYTKSEFDAYFAGRGTGQRVKLISNQGGDLVNVVLASDIHFGKVTRNDTVNKKFTLTANDTAKYPSTIDLNLDLVSGASSLVAGDYAILMQIPDQNKYFVKKAEEFTGTMTGPGTTTGYAMVNGTAYQIATDHISIDGLLNPQNLNREMTFYKFNDFIIGVKDGKTSLSSTYCVILDSKVTGIGTSADPQVTSVTILNAAKEKLTRDLDTVKIGTRQAVITRNTAGQMLVNGELVNGMVFSYSLNSNDKLELTSPEVGYTAAGFVSLARLAKNYPKSADTIELTDGWGVKKVTDSTVVFVKRPGTANEWDVLTGRANITELIANDSNNISAFLTSGTGFADVLDAMSIQNAGTSSATFNASARYGLVLGATTKGSGDGWYFDKLRIFNGQGVVEYQAVPGIRAYAYDTSGARTPVDMGYFVRFSLSSGKINEIQCVSLLSDKSFAFGYITGVSDDSVVLKPSRDSASTVHALSPDYNLVRVNGSSTVISYKGDIPTTVNPPVNNIDNGLLQYSAVLQYNNENKVDTVYLFETRITQVTNLLSGLQKQLDAMPLNIPMNTSGEITVNLPTDLLQAGVAGVSLSWQDGRNASVDNINGNALITAQTTGSFGLRISYRAGADENSKATVKVPIPNVNVNGTQVTASADLALTVVRVP